VYLLTATMGHSVHEYLRAIQEKHQCFDLSEIRDPQHPLLQGGVDKMRNARVLGKFKDELFGEPLMQFITLRPKMYCMIDVTARRSHGAKAFLVGGSSSSGLSQSIPYW
jgi:hypothetical protein